MQSKWYPLYKYSNEITRSSPKYTKLLLYILPTFLSSQWEEDWNRNINKNGRRFPALPLLPKQKSEPSITKTAHIPPHQVHQSSLQIPPSDLRDQGRDQRPQCLGLHFQSPTTNFHYPFPRLDPSQGHPRDSSRDPRPPSDSRIPPKPPSLAPQPSRRFPPLRRRLRNLPNIHHGSQGRALLRSDGHKKTRRLQGCRLRKS